MFRNLGRFDQDFDNLLLRPRKYSNILPKKYNPRQLAEQSHPRTSKEVGRPMGGLHAPSIWDRNEWFVDDFWDKFNSGRYFVGFDDSVNIVEKNDKYLVAYKEPGLKEDDIQIDFNKEDNELVIYMNQEEGSATGSHSKSYQSTMKFDKAVKVDGIQAEIDESGVELVLPKVHADNEHYHHVEVKKKQP
ncbi:uncharacterized protein LODBEIA_P03420 [Lodderomyces beijingensis]|uniref:SHSP domain-containing protein n=1 Tax=Lodderomyces beijingensis TaxID=1775926 RepID=A0ABP0ZD66_9ASCO